MPTTVERLQVEVSAKTAAARAEMAKLDKSVSSTTSSGGKRLAGLAKGMGLAFGGAAVVGGITKTIGLAMDFDRTMRMVGVQTGQTGAQIDSLGKLAKQMGQATIYSAKDAGQAMLELAKGGLTAADIRAGALKETLRLAAAGGIDLASSAGIIANGLNMFGLRAKQAGQVTTALAGAANASTASVDSLRMALSQVGSGARTSGLSIQETVAALAEFDNAGVKGSDAGTSLKTMLQRLVPQTKRAANEMHRLNLDFTDGHGNFASLATIAQRLKDHLGNLSQVQRQQALNTIFGSDASRAASILMRGGAAQVQRYTKAAKDQVATQKMANVAMKGASGAWENFKGTVETLAISMGQKALPTVTKVLNQGNELLNSANKWGPGVAHDFDGIAHAAEGAGKAIKPLATLALDLAQGFQSLPGPIKSTGVEVLAAALIWPRLQSAAVSALAPIGTGLVSTTAKAKQFRAEMTYSATRAQALQGALRSVAGPAGMGLLIAGAQSGNDALKTLSQVGGGALMGFAAGGPIGAVIGGAGGLFAALAGHMHEAAAEAARSRADYSGLAGTMDTLTGATTAATRSLVYDQLYRSKAIATLGTWGVTAREAVDAVMGQVSAGKQVSAAIQAQERDYRALTAQIKAAESARSAGIASARSGHAPAGPIPSQADIDKLKAQATAERNAIDAVKSGIPAVRASVAAARAKALATQDLTGKLHGIPKEVRTKIIHEGVPATVRDIAAVAHKYHLVPRQVRTLIQAVMPGASLKAVERAKAKLDDLSKTKPNMANFNEAIRKSGAVADTDAKRYAKSVKGSLENGPKSARADLHAYIASIKAGADVARGVASTGGHTVGAALSTGTAAGIATHAADANAAALVNNAIAAARRAAQSRSPSRKARDLVGKPIAQGVGVGMSTGAGKAAVTKGATAVADHAIEAMKHRLDHRLHEVQDRLNKAMARLGNVRQQRADFMSNIVGGMTSQASITNAGNSAGVIATNLATQATKVKEFANMLRKLKRRGWADQIIRDIAAAGVEGGYDTAKALLSASASEEKSINASYRSIYKTAHDSAKTMGDAMFGAGIRAAAGIVAGLRRRRREIQAELNALEHHNAHQRAASHDGGGRAHRAAGSGSGAASGASRAITAPRRHTAARSGGEARVVHFHFRTYYPKSETQSVTVNRSLARVAALNLV